MIESFDDLRNKLLTVAENTIKYARDIGVPSAEAFVYSENTSSLSDNKGKIDTRDGVVQGVGIRVAIDKKVGFSSCTGFSEDSIKKAIEKAHVIAKASPANPLFDSFIGENKLGTEGLLDPELLTINPEVLAEHSSQILESVDYSDKRIIGVSVDLSTEWLGYAIATTEGVSLATVTGAYSASADAVVMKEGERKTASHFVFGRKLQEISDVGKIAVERALKHLGSKKLPENTNIPTIWHPLSASAFMTGPFVRTLSGASYVEKMNPLGSKLGKQISVDSLNLVDDGQNPELPSTVAIDGEGTKVQKTTVIEKGVLKTFLYDRMYGKAAGVSTTGNASRGGMMGGIPYESVLSVSPRKLIIDPVAKNLEEIIAEYDKAVYIEETPIGLFTANPITGDFSVTSNNAFMIEKGEIAYPLQTISIAGNYYQSFMDIEHIGKDLTLSPWPVNSPTLAFKEHTISA